MRAPALRCALLTAGPGWNLDVLPGQGTLYPNGINRNIKIAMEPARFHVRGGKGGAGQRALAAAGAQARRRQRSRLPPADPPLPLLPMPHLPSPQGPVGANPPMIDFTG